MRTLFSHCAQPSAERDTHSYARSGKRARDGTAMRLCEWRPHDNDRAHELTQTYRLPESKAILLSSLAERKQQQQQLLFTGTQRRRRVGER